MRRPLRIREEGGYTMVELLVVMLILGTVMASISGLFVAGTKAEVDMNERFQAQQEARLAVTKMRREIHCATNVVGQGSPSNGYYGHVVLTLASYCRTGSGEISWCAVQVGSTQRYALHRQVGSTCSSSGAKWADYLTTPYPFKPETGITGQLAKLRVNFPVDLRPADSQRSYRLTDSIVLRNSTRAT